MNPGILLLVLVIVILLLAFVGLIIAAVVIDKSTPSTPLVIPTTPCVDTVDLSTLYQLPGTLTPCYQNGRVTNLYYLGEVTDYDFVVAPFPTAPVDVCVGFCTAVVNGVCSGPDYEGKSAEANYQACLTQLANASCVPPMPIAALGSIAYYPLSPTAASCCPASNPNC